MLGDERIKDIAERLTGEDFGQLVEREADAVIGDAPLREIVGADTLRTITGTDLGAPIRRPLGFARATLTVEQARAQDLHGARLVLVLGTLGLDHNADSGGLMRDSHRRFRAVDMLPARATGTHRIDPQLTLVQREINLLRLRQNRHGGSRSVDASAGFRIGNTLHAMHATFEFQPREDAAPGYLGDDFLVAADRALARG